MLVKVVRVLFKVVRVQVKAVRVLFKVVRVQVKAVCVLLKTVRVQVKAVRVLLTGVRGPCEGICCIIILLPVSSLCDRFLYETSSVVIGYVIVRDGQYVTSWSCT